MPSAVKKISRTGYLYVTVVDLCPKSLNSDSRIQTGQMMWLAGSTKIVPRSRLTATEVSI